MDVHNSFHSLCRICTSVTGGISVYSKEGKEISLEEKIKKFLYISISEEDMLPKTVCQICTNKLDSIHEFALMAAQTQITLVEMMGSAQAPVDDELNNDHESSWIESKSSEHESQVEENDEELKGSLLHSILTKERDEDPPGDVTELEVTVDPMLFFTDQDDEDNTDKGHIEATPIIEDTSHISNQNSEEDLSGNQSGEGKPYQCSICPRGFNTDLSLKNHLWSHISMRKILASSDLNLNRFRVEGALTSQCLCTVCGRVYPTRSTLRAHQITHSNLRPHKCSLCEKTFKRNQDLKFHINQHTGERPYRCPYCPKAFASSGNCFSHRKRMHPKQLARDKKARQLHH